jgi:pyridoxamine 5'-phosphate oxidase
VSDIIVTITSATDYGNDEVNVMFDKKDILTFKDILGSSWKLLHRGVHNFKNPFHHAALSTIDNNLPQSRMVILREFSEEDRTLVCHCDVRSPKVFHIQNNTNVSWLFYDPKKWLQLRLSGSASVHTDDDTADSQWKKMGLHHRINYCAENPPGSPAEKPTSGIPDLLLNKASHLLDTEDIRKNFAVIVCQFDEMDWLLLKLTGHIRARFSWKNDRLDGSWVVP